MKAAVIGTIFIDCKGFAGNNYNPYGRNLGNIEFVHGGVGRNVVENLAFLDVPGFFVSTVDDSALGNEVLKRLSEAKVNLDYCTVTSENGMGMWLAILDQKGNLLGSISKMPDLAFLERIILKKGQEIVESASHVVLELDLNEKISKTVIDIANKRGRPVYGIPGNLEVILNNPDLLSGIECFICNDIEAGKLIDTDLTGMDAEELQDLLSRFVKKTGLASMVITLGERGAVYYDAKTGDTGYQPAFPVEVIDSTGAGDAFFSGTVMGLMKNQPLSQAVVYGTRVASLTIQSEENNCPLLSDILKREGKRGQGDRSAVSARINDIAVFR